MTTHSQPTALTLQEVVQTLSNLSVDDGQTALEPINLKSDEILFSQGDVGDSVYLLMAGALGVRVRQADGTEVVIDKLAPGAVVGELALLSGQNRTATVYALNDAGLLRLNKQSFEALPLTQQKVLGGVDNTMVARLQRLQLSKILHALFGDLDTSAIHNLQEQLEWLHLSNGDVLFRQDDEADGMYIVVNGRLRYTAVDENKNLVASNEVGSGETIGEYALLTDERRSATAYAVRETTLVKMNPTRFEHLSQEYPQLTSTITRVIVARQQRSLKHNKPVAPQRLTIAIVPATANVATDQFAQALATAMTTHGATLALNAAQFNEHTNHANAAQTPLDAPSNLAIVSLLEQLEDEQKYLLYVADAQPTVWTRRCLGQADRVLLLANPQEPPALGEVEQLLATYEVPIRSELVLWHSPQTERPHGTAVWLQNRPIRTHHHVRQGTAKHMQRLARRLTGHAVALVLSGGAARGFAHLGVHRAMEELGIPVDYVGATSMGAVVGASLLTHQTNAEVMVQSSSYADPKVLFDRTLPLTSVMASKKVTEFTKQAFGDWQVEDLWTPFFCIASNLNTAEAVLYQQGALWRAVRASLAIPGVFAPVMQDGDVIVDGAVIDNFPAKRMADLCESTHIIGVNVSPHQERKRKYDYETDISGWRILFSRLNPFTKPLRTPSLVGTIMRTFEINSMRRAKEEERVVDLMIYPDVKRFKTTAYEEYKAITQVGYEAAIGPLTAWRDERFTAS